MTIGGPRIDEGHLLLGAPAERAGRGDDIAEPPADGFPEVIWAVDMDEEYLPIVFFSDEEEVGEVQVGILGGVGVVAPRGEDEDVPRLDIHLNLEFDDNINRIMELDDEDDEDTGDEDTDDEDTDDEDTDDSNETSEDSGYDSMSEDEELIEDIDEEDPLVQQLPWGRLQQGWREEYPPVPSPPPVAGPHQLTVGRPQQLPQQRAVPPPEGLASEESAPSTSGLGSSAKRSREEDQTEQVSMKRQPWNCEKSHKDPAPSGSSLGSSANRMSWHPFLYESWSDDSDTD